MSEKLFIQFSFTIVSIGTLTKTQNIKLPRFLEFILKGSFLAVNALMMLQGWQKAMDHPMHGCERSHAQRLALAPGLQN